jgi:hypothetical protein
MKLCPLVAIPTACVCFQESKFDGILLLVQKARSKRLTYALVEGSTEGSTCTGCKHACDSCEVIRDSEMEKVIRYNDQSSVVNQV